MLRKQKEEEERKEKLKRENPIAWHKENVAAMEDQSAELWAYVRKHFDQQRTLLNHQGQKGYCDCKCGYMNNNQHVLS